MPRPFIHDDFLLHSSTASALFHEFARECPILDYHCHLPPQDIATNRTWENLTQLWLGGDHYKWRALRANGVPERLVTGDAPDREKFQAWAETVPKTLCNPLYHWTHVELKRYFGIDELLDGSSAQRIWDQTSEQLRSAEFSCHGILARSRVRALCTTDDPIDDLKHHAAIAASGKSPARVLPTFRPDKAMAVESPDFKAYVQAIGAASDCDISSFSTFVKALEKRHDYFHAHGCRLSDHGLNRPYGEECTPAQAALIFDKAMAGSAPSAEESAQFKAAMLFEFGRMNHAKGWVQQIHFGVMRNVNPRTFKTLGPDTGFDTIGDAPVASGLVNMLGRLESANALTKTILYNLNPADNELIATLIGCFQDGSTPGKIQFGSGWWFLDQKDGIERQLRALGNQGLLSRFVGMLTDSRSFLSYSRHEYFRRVLCNLLGDDMERGLLPDDLALVGGMVRDICFGNAEAYFSLGA
ncbi:MAG TPA: glucuronate isomerase [Holophaga sp.]|nr:glucuronate isomerase [Holophaga sp.]